MRVTDRFRLHEMRGELIQLTYRQYFSQKTVGGLLKDFDDNTLMVGALPSRQIMTIRLDKIEAIDWHILKKINDLAEAMKQSLDGFSQAISAHLGQAGGKK